MSDLCIKCLFIYLFPVCSVAQKNEKTLVKPKIIIRLSVTLSAFSHANCLQYKYPANIHSVHTACEQICNK